MIDHDHFAKKIPAYFDGTLRDGEKTEFEAYVGGNPEFAHLFRQKEQEHLNLKKRIPDFTPEEDALQTMSTEIREAITHLFKDEDAPLSTRVVGWFKEKL
jgi:hypothetical protein